MSSTALGAEKAIIFISEAHEKFYYEKLKHSDFSTTANIYAHLDAASKQKSAETMEEFLKLV